MELRVGPLHDDQVTSLVELLKDGTVKQRLTAAGLQTAVTVDATSGARTASGTGSVTPAGAQDDMAPRGTISPKGAPLGLIMAVLAIVAVALISLAVYLGVKSK
jgi:hypothetical protein